MTIDKENEYLHDCKVVLNIGTYKVFYLGHTTEEAKTRYSIQQIKPCLFIIQLPTCRPLWHAALQKYNKAYTLSI